MFFSGCSTNYCATLRLQIEKITLSYNLMFHLPEFISQQITISRAIFHFRNYAVKNKKPDTHLDNHCIKIGVRLCVITVALIQFETSSEFEPTPFRWVHLYL